MYCNYVNYVYELRKISLNLLLPEGSATAETHKHAAAVPLFIPDEHILLKYTNQWMFDIPYDMPAFIGLHERTEDWMKLSHQGQGHHGKCVHYFTDGSAHPDPLQASWAWVKCTSERQTEDPQELTYIGWLAGPVVIEPLQPQYCGAHALDSICGEASALFWAVLNAIAETEHYVDFYFHFDAMNVGFAMDGAFKTASSHPILGYLRSLMQTLEALIGTARIHNLHAKGHADHPINECANTLANRAAWSPDWLPDLSTIDLQPLLRNQAKDLKWLWIQARKLQHSHALPECDQLQASIPLRSSLLPTDPSLDWTFGYGLDGPALQYALLPDMQLLSFNVRSLKLDGSDDPEAITAGRTGYLEKQLFDLDFTIIGLQETRTKLNGVFDNKIYTKFKSAAHKGHGGVELWVHHQLSCGTIGGKPFRLRTDKAVVLHAGPELLCVRFPGAAGEDIVITVGHAPHKGHTTEDKDQWWIGLSRLLVTLGPNIKHILLMDANAALGHITTEGIGGLHAMPEDENGVHLRELLRALGLWLPSTFPDVHTGPSETWFSPAAKGPSGLRNDYIAIPLDWQWTQVRSHIVPDLDAAQSSIDHMAIALQIRSPMKTRTTCPTVTQRPQVDWANVRKCTDRSIWDKVFDSLPQPPWQVDVHQHWQICRDNLVQRLAEFFPLQKSRPRKPYISEETWNFRNRKQALRRQHALHVHLCKDIQLLAAFQALRHGLPLRAALLQGLLWALRCNAAHHKIGIELREIQRQLRTALRHQRCQFLEQIADEASSAPRAEIYAKLKQAGFCSTRRRRTRPLPMLIDSEGLPYDKEELLKEAWRQHFAAIECGRRVSAPELLQLCILTEIEQQHRPLPNLLEELPSLHQFELSLLRCKANRAAGPDLLPPELCKRTARWLSFYLAPLYLKCSIYAQEPLQWKGGILHEVYKHRGAMSSPDSYRGILVSSHLAKCYHNTFRAPTLDWHIATADELQFGGIPRKGVDMATHVVKTFLAVAQKHKRPCSIIFIDIKSAYYRLLRCLAIGPTCTTSELATLFATMGLPDILMQELMKHADDEDALTSTGCPQWLAQFSVCFHQSTWFQMRSSSTVTHTLRGTRPGDGFADLLFNLAVGKLLRELEMELNEAGLQTTVTWNGMRNTDASYGEESSSHTLNVVWADDLAILLHHEEPEALVQQTEYVLQTYIHRFASRGLLLNFDKGKTECLMLLRGKGSRTVSRKLFACPAPSLEVPIPGFGLTQVRLVHIYKHLGGILHASGHHLQELRVRVGAANSAFNQHRKAVYQNKALKLDRRMQLFQACTLSVLYWNAATWPALRPAETRYFHGAARRLLIRLLLTDFDRETIQHWPTHRLYATAGLLQPELHIRLSRLSYYGNAVRHGPPALWALLAAEEAWLNLIKADLEWLSWNCQGHTYRPFFSRPDGPEYWHNLIVQKPTTWKGLLKKAKLHALLQGQIHSEADTFNRQVASLFENYNHALKPCPTTPDTSVLPFACIPCKMTFPTKAAWAVHAFKLHGRLARARPRQVRSLYAHIPQLLQVIQPPQIQ